MWIAALPPRRRRICPILAEEARPKRIPQKASTPSGSTCRIDSLQEGLQASSGDPREVLSCGLCTLQYARRGGGMFMRGGPPSPAPGVSERGGSCAWRRNRGFPLRCGRLTSQVKRASSRVSQGHVKGQGAGQGSRSRARVKEQGKGQGAGQGSRSRARVKGRPARARQGKGKGKARARARQGQGQGKGKARQGRQGWCTIVYVKFTPLNSPDLRIAPCMPRS